MAGGYPSFLIAGLNIPDNVMAHPALQSILGLAAESLVLTDMGIFGTMHTQIRLTCTHTASSKHLDTVVINRHRHHERKTGSLGQGAQVAWKVSRAGSVQFSGTILAASFLGCYCRCRCQHLCGEMAYWIRAIRAGRLRQRDTSGRRDQRSRNTGGWGCCRK